jgi:hypothetical protein
MKEMTYSRSMDEIVLALQMFELPNELEFECSSGLSTCPSMQSTC